MKDKMLKLFSNDKFLLRIFVPTVATVVALIVLMLCHWFQPAKAISCDGFYAEINTARDGKLYVTKNNSSTELFHGDFLDEQQLLKSYSYYLSNCKLVW